MSIFLTVMWFFDQSTMRTLARVSRKSNTGIGGDAAPFAIVSEAAKKTLA